MLTATAPHHSLYHRISAAEHATCSGRLTVLLITKTDDEPASFTLVGSEAGLVRDTSDRQATVPCRPVAWDGSPQGETRARPPALAAPILRAVEVLECLPPSLLLPQVRPSDDHVRAQFVCGRTLDLRRRMLLGVRWNLYDHTLVISIKDKHFS